MAAWRISSVVSESVARAEPSASSGSSPRVTRHCRAGASPAQSQHRCRVSSEPMVLSSGSATSLTIGRASSLGTAELAGVNSCTELHCKRRVLHAGKLSSRAC